MCIIEYAQLACLLMFYNKMNAEAKMYLANIAHSLYVRVSMSKTFFLCFFLLFSCGILVEKPMVFCFVTDLVKPFNKKRKSNRTRDHNTKMQKINPYINRQHFQDTLFSAVQCEAVYS